MLEVSKSLLTITMPKLNNCQNGTVYILFIEVYLIEKSELVPEKFSLELV